MPQPKRISHLVFDASRVGLGNRIRALAGYQALARCLNARFSLHWLSDVSCPASFPDLFHADIETIEFRSLEILRRDPAVKVFTDTPWFSGIWERLGQPHVDAHRFDALARGALQALRPRRELAQAAEEFAAKHGLSRIAGIHIRHTDNLEAYDSWTKYCRDFDPAAVSQLQGFAAEVERPPAARFLLCTDNAELERLWRKHYKDRIVIRRKRFVPGARPSLLHPRRPTTIEDALIDLLLLGRCARIIGTYFSSFAKVAAIWFEVPYAEVRGHDCVANDFVRRMQSHSGGAPSRAVTPRGG